jgi:phenylalanine-specific permease
MKTRKGKDVKNASKVSEHSADTASDSGPTLQRGLKNRHIQLIALGALSVPGYF